METGKYLLVRADGDARIGSGHLMRSLALAQAWQDKGGRAGFVVSDASDKIAERLESEGCDLYPNDFLPGSDGDSGNLLSVAEQVGAQWVVADGYDFCGEYQQKIMRRGFNLLVVDDYAHGERYLADIVLNVNISASREMYGRLGPNTNLLLGTRYALLRREFVDWKDWRRSIPEKAGKILVTLGGADPDNVTSDILCALAGIPVDGLEITVIAGASNRHGDRLQALIDSLDRPVRLEQNVSDMPSMLAESDLAVAGGGGTTWELAFMGLPSVVIVMAENQRSSAEQLHQSGFAICLGTPWNFTVDDVNNIAAGLIESREKRAEMSLIGKSLVDGMGADRVVEAMLNQSSSRGIGID